MTTRIYSTDTDAGTITVINRDSQGGLQPIAQIPVGNGPRGAVKFTADGRGYVSNCGGDTISEIDSLTNRETARIQVGIAPRGIGLIPGDRFALVSNSGSNTISIVDLANRKEIHQIAVGRDPRHMAITSQGNWAYAAIYGAHHVAKIATEALLVASEPVKLTEVMEVARIPTGAESYPYSLAIDRTGQYAYVANTQVPYVSVIDTSTDKVVAQVDVGSKGGRAVAFSPDNRLAFVTIEDISEVVAIDTTSRRVVVRREVGPGPRGIAVDATNHSIYLAAFTRTGLRPSAGFPFGVNTLTVLDVSQMDSSFQAQPTYGEVRVGAGPCSVSVLNLN